MQRRKSTSRKKRLDRKNKQIKYKKPIYTRKSRLLEKHNWLISFFVYFALIAGSFTLLYIKVIHKVKISSTLIVISGAIGGFALIFLIESCIRGYKYAGLKRLVLFCKNLFVNPFLKKEKLASNDRWIIEKVYSQYLSDIRFLVICVGAVTLLETLEMIFYGGQESLIGMILSVVVAGIVFLIVKVIKYIETRQKVRKYHSLQYGTVVAKNQWFEFSHRGSQHCLYTVDVMLKDGRIYEGIVYDELHYNRFKSGESKCIVYGRSLFNVRILAIDWVSDMTYYP